MHAKLKNLWNNVTKRIWSNLFTNRHVDKKAEIEFLLFFSKLLRKENLFEEYLYETRDFVRSATMLFCFSGITEFSAFCNFLLYFLSSPLDNNSLVLSKTSRKLIFPSSLLHSYEYGLTT
jgi:hypothetical protein